MVSKVRIPCFKVHQWLETWTQVKEDADSHKSSPPKNFYLLKMKAKHLKQLSGVKRRETTKRDIGEEDLGIQRKLEPDRIKEIRQFVKYGFPLSTMRESSIPSQVDSLAKPGWLPSAIIVNIRTKDDGLEDEVDPKDLLNVNDKEEIPYIELPVGFDEKWTKKKSHPIQIIDGQHRLYAFEDLEFQGDFELPVVAFHGLDIGWQAYLFWVINIKPKKINSSLAFDLYPLLRTQSWLDAAESHSIYREARAQEIVETLWGYKGNPWYHNINMLGETGKKYPISQSAMIKALQSSYLSKFKKGIFIVPLKENNYLPWGRSEQAALIAIIWNELHNFYSNNENQFSYNLFDFDKSLLMRDQGVNGVLRTTNDLLRLHLSTYSPKTLSLRINIEKDSTKDVVEKIISQMEPLHSFIQTLSKYICNFEWRSGDSEDLPEPQLTTQRSYKGSGGYKLVYDNLLTELSKCDNTPISQLASKIKKSKDE